MPIVLPTYVENIMETLEKNNYQAFLVGGSIRDLLLGTMPHDFDIATNAKPHEILDVFKDYKTLQVGMAFGTIVIVQKEGLVELTTYRIEEEYLDGRRPSRVAFSNELFEDLKRRDFTINALAYNKSFGLIDPFNGRKDLKNKVIKTVGEPKERFKEDHLRILRGVRLASQLGFTIEENTYYSCKSMGPFLKKISVERIREEFFKIILSKRSSYGMELLKNLNLIEIIIPELVDTINFNQYNPHHDKDVFYHSLCVMENSPPLLEIRLAALLHDIGKPKAFTLDEEGIGHFYGHDKISVEISKIALTRLKCSNKLIKDVSILVGEHMTAYGNYTEKGLKRLINRVGKDNIFKLIELQKSDKICSAGDRNIDFLIEREKAIKKILDSEEPYKKNQLAINGHDIITLGFSQGKIIGEILEYLLELVMDYPELNNKENLVNIIKREF